MKYFLPRKEKQLGNFDFGHRKKKRLNKKNLNRPVWGKIITLP